jgi:hypothetical protein
MSRGEPFDSVTVALVDLMGSALFDFRLNGGLTTKVTGGVLSQELLEKRVFFGDTALGRSNIPVVDLHAVTICNSRKRMALASVMSKTRGSAGLGVVDASQDVEADRARLMHHAIRIITDGALVG